MLYDYNLGFFAENENALFNLLGKAAHEGKAIVGYYGCPYINTHFGNVQFILHTQIKPEGKEIRISTWDIHNAGSCIWEVRLGSMDLDPEDSVKTEKTCAVSRLDGRGLTIVKLLNADVVPSFDENEIIRMQVVAHPDVFDYYEDEDSYMESCPKNELGKSFCLGDGSLIPLGLLVYRNIDSSSFEKEKDQDDRMWVRGTVKCFRLGSFKLDEDMDVPYVRCIIETEYGDLEIVHAYDQVKEEQRPLLKQGSIFTGVVSIAGDVAIGAYEKGIVRDVENHLKLLKYTMTGKGDAERLRLVLSDDVVYESQVIGKTFSGKDAVIERLRYVHDNNTEDYHGYLATIVSHARESEELYPAGTRCMVLGLGPGANYESILFIEMDEENNIRKIVTSQDDRYQFSIDRLPESLDAQDSFETPETYQKAMILRATLIGADIEEEDLPVEPELLEALFFPAGTIVTEAVKRDTWNEATVVNLFTYLFSKASERKWMADSGEGDPSTVTLSVEDAIDGRVELAVQDKDRFRHVFMHGESFYKDFARYYPFEPEPDEAYIDEVIKALALVQWIGDGYADVMYEAAQEEKE